MAKRGRPRGSKNKKKVKTFRTPIIKYTPVNTFWEKVIKGFKKFLCPPSKHTSK